MSGFPTFHNDPTIRFDHTPVINKFAFKMNHVGAHDSDSVDVAAFVYTDVNSVFVSDTTGNDTTGTGIQSNPYKTILKGINSTTSIWTYVIILDSVLYAEDLSSATTTFFQGLYAATAQTPTLTTRLLGYVPADANSIFFDKTGSDGDAGTQAAPKLTIAGAVAATDATHQAIVCQDSETYTEPAIEFTGNFLGMYAADGFKPTFIPTTSYASCDYAEQVELLSETEVDATSADDNDCAILVGGNVINVYYDDDDGNKGKLCVVDSFGTILIKESTFKNSSIIDPKVCALIDGNAVIAFQDVSDSDKGKFVIVSDLGVVLVGPTIYSSNTAGGVDCVGLSNGNFVIAFAASGGAGKFEIYDKDGVVLPLGTVEFESGTTQSISLVLLDSTNFVICFVDSGDGGKGKFVIYDKDGVVLPLGTVVFNTAATSTINSAKINNGSFVIVYNHNFVIYDENGGSIATETDFNAAGVFGSLGISALQNGGWVVTYGDGAAGAHGKFSMYDELGEDGAGSPGSIVSAVEFSSGSTRSCSVATLESGEIIIFYNKNDTSGEYVIWLPYSWTGIRASDVSTLNGWIVDGNEQNLLIKLVEPNGAKPTIKWNDIKDTSTPLSIYTNGYAIYGDNETDIYNCIIKDNDGGIYLTAGVNDCLIHDSQFIRNNKTWAIHIDGAAASPGDITVEHTDLFQNYSGAYFENNHGANETIKNMIVHNNSNDGIKADIAMTLTYTIRTDDNDNVSDGTAVQFSNPLYWNEGAISELLTNLNLKTLIEGFSTDSPAKDHGDDNRNAGSYDVRYIGSSTTWTSITIDKPLHGTFGVSYNPVGGNKSTGRDGTIEYNKDGQTADLVLEYEAMRNADNDLVLTMWVSEESTVRVYPDPVTNPDTYNTMIMIRGELQASAKNYKLTRSGKEGVKLAFARKFE